ncbi:hypothetical protein [Salipiger sp.]|uniref:hypothetical protein n=1 Tax=Salipiger sp. TaxID=2078585 RepID=UPI003A97D2AA
MARACPSAAAVKNVIEALVACGMAPGAVRVGSDGSFTVEAQEKTVAESRGPRHDEPKRWGHTKG